MTYSTGATNEIRTVDCATGATGTQNFLTCSSAKAWNYQSCSDLLAAGFTQSGVYTINPDGFSSMDVYCDQVTDGGGWALVMETARSTTYQYSSTVWTDADNTVGRVPFSRYDGSSAAAASTPAMLRSLGITTNGVYWLSAWFNSAQTTPVQAYVSFNMLDGKDWVQVFDLYQGITTSGVVDVNLLGYNLPFRGFDVQKPDLTHAYSYYSSLASYNAGSSYSASTSGGNMAGFKVILGYAGGHGWYTSGQNTCNWSSGAGAVGAGWDGSTCGTYATSLRMGTGSSSIATYTLITGRWRYWIWMDTAWPTTDRVSRAFYKLQGTETKVCLENYNSATLTWGCGTITHSLNTPRNLANGTPLSSTQATTGLLPSTLRAVVGGGSFSANAWHRWGWNPGTSSHGGARVGFTADNDSSDSQDSQIGFGLTASTSGLLTAGSGYAQWSAWTPAPSPLSSMLQGQLWFRKAVSCAIRTCSASPTQTGYTIASGSSSYGSTRTVTCASGYSGTATSVVCRADGTWSSSQGCCLNGGCCSPQASTGYVLGTGNGLAFVNSWAYPTFTGWTDTRTSTCGTLGMMGGSNIFGSGASTSYTFANLAAGTYTLMFDYYHIDSWDGESGIATWNSVQIWSRAHTLGGTNLCGNSGYGDSIGCEFPRTTVTVTHSGGNGVLTFTSNLNEGSSNEAFGVNNIYFGSSYAIKCAQGYQTPANYMDPLTSAYLTSPGSIVCQSSGSWTAATGCVVIDCGAPIFLGYVFGYYASTTYLASITPTCEPGFQGTATATICRQNGVWSTPTGCTSRLKVWLPLDSSNADAASPAGATSTTFSATISTTVARLGVGSMDVMTNTFYTTPVAYSRSSTNFNTECLTMAAWLYKATTTDAAYACPVTWGIDSEWAACLCMDNNGMYATAYYSPGIGVAGAGYSPTSGYSAQAADQWFHIAMTTCPGQGVQMYVNGAQVGSAGSAVPSNYRLVSSGTRALPNRLQLGAQFPTSWAWKGYVDDVRIYDYAFTATEIANLYSFVQGGGCGIPIPTTGYALGSGSTTANSVYTMTCATGYTGSAASLTCQSNLAWTSQSGVCTIVSCGEPSSTTGYIINTGGSTYLSTRTCTCATGYTGTAAVLTCQASGAWTAPSGCTIVSCSSSPTQTGYTIAGGASTYGSTRTTTCASPYTGSASSITCQSNGTWSTASSCQAPSCVGMKALGYGSGTYSITVTGYPSVSVYCDMSASGQGAYTFYLCSGCANTCRRTDGNGCTQYGMNILVPRSQFHNQRWYAWAQTRGDIEDIMNPPGVVRAADGCGTCTGVAMNYDAIVAAGGDWRGIDYWSGGSGRFWLRGTTYSEPNGDYTADCWLYSYWINSAASDQGFNDHNCNYCSTTYTCSTNDVYT